MTEKKKIFYRVMFISILIVFIANIIILRIISIQGDSELENIYPSTIKFKEIPPQRGNIFDINGDLLATSVPSFTIAFDSTVPNDSLFFKNYKDLARDLSELLADKTSYDYEKLLLEARENKKKYLKIKSGLSYSELKQIKSFPIFSSGRFKGGLIYSRNIERIRPFGKLCERVIGYGRNNKDVGIEKSYDNFLKGIPGKQMMQKINNGIWKPISNKYDIEPKIGYDIFSTIDIRFQDIAHRALIKTLKKYNAESGVIIVMEVKSGAIKAMSSLNKSSFNIYKEYYNHAIGSNYEPGSTFKLASLLIALENKIVDTLSKVDTGNGRYKFYDRYMYDSNYKQGGHGVLSLSDIFKLSSNIGVSKIINEGFKDDPDLFVNELKKIGVNINLNFDLIGQEVSYLKNSSHSTWSKVSLPWMAFGYEIQISPLQLLTFYNSIANDGNMVQPYIVQKIQNGQKLEYEKQKNVLISQICSKETLKVLKNFLIEVVEDGTASNIFSEVNSCAGKTGTTKIAKDGSYSNEYRSSFVGFFPAESPKYSCMVLVNKPDVNIGFYGNVVAAPVFAEVRDLLFSREIILPSNRKVFKDKKLFFQIINKLLKNKNNDFINEFNIENFNIVKSKINEKNIPSVIGMNKMDAIYILENSGLTVKSNGNGIVESQSLSVGDNFNLNDTIMITLI